MHEYYAHCKLCRAQGAVDGFLEEIIVRRELADNFCYVRSCSKRPC